MGIIKPASTLLLQDCFCDDSTFGGVWLWQHIRRTSWQAACCTEDCCGLGIDVQAADAESVVSATAVWQITSHEP
jgi:hypothetical protein